MLRGNNSKLVLALILIVWLLAAFVYAGLYGAAMIAAGAAVVLLVHVSNTRSGR